MSRESTKARRPARRRVFVADPPLASLVDEAVAQLKIPPQRFGLPHRYIHSVTQLTALLHQASHRLARRLGPATYCYWKHRAAGEMRPDTVGQVRVAPRAPVCTGAERINRGHLSEVESSSAANALGDLVVPTVDEEECAFLGAQNTRLTTIEMTENPEAEDDGVLRRNRQRALRARRGLRFRHWSIPNAKGERMGLP